MPVIIIEGVDGTGKSTLADKLEKLAGDRWNVIREHRGEPQMPPLDEYMKPLLRLEARDLLIADRWHVGELIYGPIYRGESTTDGAINRLIEAYLDHIGAVKIIMSPELSTVRRRLRTRGEDYLQKSDVRRVYNFYRDYASDNNYKIIARGTEAEAKAILKGIK